MIGTKFRASYRVGLQRNEVTGKWGEDEKFNECLVVTYLVSSELQSVCIKDDEGIRMHAQFRYESCVS